VDDEISDLSFENQANYVRDDAELEKTVATKSLASGLRGTKRQGIARIKKKSRRGSNPKVDATTIDALKEASQAAETKLQEMIRHNQFTESWMRGGWR
jgi:hypothetical protein